ncbi:MAG: KpsF/GutQ family sugar-phosphate isomerase [Alphaproteobacteria bacterium]|nr:KpsF/GutQ family sugar-phosphate isomerase [Alphaproteobacteria bacterium]
MASAPTDRLWRGRCRPGGRLDRRITEEWWVLAIRVARGSGPTPSRQALVQSDLAVARRLLEQEADAVRAAGAALDERFAAAIETLLNLRGRVVVAGVGKSGHIARKIAATMASTGTPALFVHPGEASHGDLGMVTRDDAVVLLSKSGESDELSALVSYAKRFRIPLIAMTANQMSELGQAADVLLLLPDVREACPMGLAPTTSTTMMLALGDALAVALLERRGFSADDFHALHPGGRLGRRLQKVSDIMRKGDEIPLAPVDALMQDVLLVMSAKNFGCAGIVEDGDRLVGIVTDGDLRRHMSDRLLAQTAGRVMTADPQTIGPDALAAEAVGIMAGRITNLFVVKDTRVVGILRLHDCLQAGVA